MFKNSEPPISLFSFQDIITSLTGIVIFFLLIFALNLFEVREAPETSDASPEEIEAARQLNELLKKQIVSYENDLRAYHRKLLCPATEKTSLRIELFRLQKKIQSQDSELATIRENLLRHQQELAHLKEEMQSIDIERKNLEEKKKKLDEKEQRDAKLRE